jgi:methylated-DNA-[protein]-cysteine S-methyltransferase
VKVDVLDAAVEINASAVVEPPAALRAQVREYERGERRTFDLHVELPGGVLGDAMRVMAEIPYGETRTDPALATELDTAPVVVGRACARNPLPVVVPCHRVVGSDGGLGGYSAADGVATKRRLLEFESRSR